MGEATQEKYDAAIPHYPDQHDQEKEDEEEEEE